MEGNRVAIIGAGIAGLTAAIFLRRKGFEVTVYEKTPAIAPVGAGIGLSANALNVLESMGLASKILAAGTSLELGIPRPLGRGDSYLFVVAGWIFSSLAIEIFFRGTVICPVRRARLHIEFNPAERVAAWKPVTSLIPRPSAFPRPHC